MKKTLLALLAVLMALPFGLSARNKQPVTLSVISYNIRTGEADDGTNSWRYRYPASAMMIMDQKPDIFGLQEAYDYQVRYLEEYCPGYKSVGVGREDGKKEGEHMSVFYNKKTVSLLKWGTYWLSKTPDKPSIGWDAACKRTATWADNHVGFPDAAVDRIIPPVHCEAPLDVAVEEYFEWDVERDSFVGEVPAIEGITPVDNILAYIERKLLTLNTGHTTAAYLGKIRGYDTIEACVSDPELFSAVRTAMQQSGEGLVRKFGFDHDAHFAYIEKVLRRFSNPFLKDECDRVGREPLRKLAPDDRLILPIMNAKRFGLPYDKLLPAVGAALHFDNPGDPESVEMLRSIANAGLAATIVKYTGIHMDDPLVNEIIDAYYKVKQSWR